MTSSLARIGAQARTPVDRRLAQVRQAVAVDHGVALRRRGERLVPRRAAGGGAASAGELARQCGDRAGLALVGVVPGVEDLQEHPLRPAVVRLVGGRHAAPHVVGQAQATQLAAHVGDVRLGVHPRVHARGDGVLLGRQAEGVVADRVQHVVARHPLEAAVHVGADVAEGVADVEAGAGRVREHVEDEQLLPTGHLLRLGERPGGVRCLEGVVCVPLVLPALLDVGSQRGAVAERGDVIGGHRSAHRTGPAMQRPGWLAPTPVSNT